MTTAHFTQYMLPDGRKKAVEITVSDDLKPQLKAIEDAGCRLECEVLTTGEVSVTVFHMAEEIDVDIEIIQNGPGVPKAVDQLIRRFTADLVTDEQPAR